MRDYFDVRPEHGGREAMQVAMKDGSATSEQLFHLRAAVGLWIRTITKVRGLVGNE